MPRYCRRSFSSWNRSSPAAHSLSRTANAAGGVLGHQIELKFGDVGGLEAEKIKAIGEAAEAAREIELTTRRSRARKERPSVSPLPPGGGPPVLLIRISTPPSFRSAAACSAAASSSDSATLSVPTRIGLPVA